MHHLLAHLQERLDVLMTHLALHMLQGAKEIIYFGVFWITSILTSKFRLEFKSIRFQTVATELLRLLAIGIYPLQMTYCGY